MVVVLVLITSYLRIWFFDEASLVAVLDATRPVKNPVEQNSISEIKGVLADFGKLNQNITDVIIRI